MRRTYPASTRPLRAVSRSAAVPLLASALVSALLGCVDTSVPDSISRELGEGRTDGPFCAPDVLEFFPPEELRLHVIDRR